jgi:hypothetical protein
MPPSLGCDFFLVLLRIIEIFYFSFCLDLVKFLFSSSFRVTKLWVSSHFKALKLCVFSYF